MVLASALLPLMIAASFDFGVTWDEASRQRGGEFVWDYFRGLRSRSFLDSQDARYYPGLFDVICVAAQRSLSVDPYVLRHAINAVFGWIGVVYCGRLAARLFGTWAGVLAMLLLAGSPRYFAHSMNNPKDLPFAAATMVVLYYFSTASTHWPYISRTAGVKIVAALAIALNIRAGALLYLGYLAALVTAFVVAERNLSWRRLADTAARLTMIAAAVLLLGTVFWPWAQAAPLTRPFEALLYFSNYPWTGVVLFNGQEYTSANLPWSYGPLWFLIATPPVVLAGAVLSIPGWRVDEWTLSRSALWAIFIFPLLLVIVRHSALYDGLRHLLFIYPILVVLAASGWAAWLSEGNRPWVRRSTAVLLAAGLINVLAFHVRSHPNQAVYFNELVGGPRGAFARFDMDYWGNCVLEAVAWSAQTARTSGLPTAISGFPEHLVRLNAERFPELSATPEEEARHHYTVQLNRSTAEGMTELANRADALYRVQTADGAVLCVVLPGPAFNELRPRLF